MFLEGQIKLSRIFEHNFDKRTDRLYEPLRLAIETLPPNPASSRELPSSPQLAPGSLAEMRCSQINISRAEQDLIKNSTFIPINKKLVQTNNPEKHVKARSRSYRTLSVEQRIGSPLPDKDFPPSLAATNKQKQVEIVYDYDTSQHRPEPAKLNEYYGSITSSTLPRTRSATFVSSTMFASSLPQQRAETRMVKVQRRPSNHKSATSIHLNEPTLPTQPQERQDRQAESKAVAGGQYYENCKKYAFKNDMKEKQKVKRLRESNDSLEKELIKMRTVPAESDYKYNIFNLLDDPINTNCANGLCHKNQIIAPRIKKRW